MGVEAEFIETEPIADTYTMTIFACTVPSPTFLIAVSIYNKMDDTVEN